MTMDAAPPAGTAALLILADSRLPAGGHAHSGGLEPAVAAGRLSTVDDLGVFLRGRLRTSGLVAAALAAAACRHARAETVSAGADATTAAAGQSPPSRAGAPPEPGAAVPVPGAAVPVPGAAVPVPGAAVPVPGAVGHRASADGADFWAALDAEADARTPAPALRLASRQQGRALLRAGRSAWTSPGLDRLAASPGGPHHSVALGVVGAAAGCDPVGVARVAAYLSVSGPASAAVRLRGFDPLAVHAVLVGLAADVDRIGAEAAEAARGPLPDLPSAAAPLLDVLAETHARTEVRLFAS